MLENISGGTDPSAVLQWGLRRQSASCVSGGHRVGVRLSRGLCLGSGGRCPVSQRGVWSFLVYLGRKNYQGRRLFFFLSQTKCSPSLHSIVFFFSLGNSHVKVNLLYLKPDVIAEYSSFAAQYWGIDFWFYSLHGLHFLLRSGSWGSVPYCQVVQRYRKGTVPGATRSMAEFTALLVSEFILFWESIPWKRWTLHRYKQ